MIEVLDYFEREARKKFEEEYEKIRKEFNLPPLEDIEKNLEVTYPKHFKCSYNVIEALLWIVRRSADRYLIFLSDYLFPKNPIHALESPFKDRKLREEAMRWVFKLLRIYWTSVRVGEEKESIEKQIEFFKDAVKQISECRKYILNLSEKILEKIKEEEKKLEEGKAEWMMK